VADEERENVQATSEQGEAAEGQDKSEEHVKAEEAEESRQKAREKMDELEENPPEKLEDWPDDQAKYETFGGPEGEHSYEEGPEAKLGPSSLRHREGGGVEIAGEEADDASEYKAEPIPGGPTDPDAKNAPGAPDLSEVGHTGEDYEDGKPMDKSGEGEGEDQGKSEASGEGGEAGKEGGDEQGGSSQPAEEEQKS
jgi:hypothetical protein